MTSQPIKYSILDLSPITTGGTVTQALQQTVTMAQNAENWGYHRFWVAEHHNIPAIASAANTVIVGQILAHTKKLIVGAGGVLLPNHFPLVVAEQYGTLAQYYPNRVDLGLGRGGAKDIATAQALGQLIRSGEYFPSYVEELLNYIDGVAPTAVRAPMAEEVSLPVWILGTSLFGAKLAAKLGLPFVFGAHFAPVLLKQARSIYYDNFKPSTRLKKPYFIISVGVYAAADNIEAHRLSTSIKIHFSEMITGNIGKLCPPTDNLPGLIAKPILEEIDRKFSVTAIGNPESVHSQLQLIVDRYQPDEVMVCSLIYDEKARYKSFKIAADALQNIHV
jgi:luciferase family oxidoreductase group 1